MTAGTRVLVVEPGPYGAELGSGPHVIVCNIENLLLDLGDAFPRYYLISRFTEQTSMTIVPLIYRHRHGTDVFLVKVPNGVTTLPEITNELIDAIVGIAGTGELEKGEDAEWGGSVNIYQIPELPSLPVE